jgi:hypothetical protein
VEEDRKKDADQEMAVGWNVAAMTEEDSEAAEKVWTELAKKRTHQDAECTSGEVEQEATWWQEVMGSVLDATVKKISIYARSKMWWNADIQKRRQAVGEEKRRRRNSEQAARAKAELQKSIRISSRKMFTEYLQTLRANKVSRAARHANPRAGTTVESLTNRECKRANTSLAKEEMLR